MENVPDAPWISNFEDYYDWWFGFGKYSSDEDDEPRAIYDPD